MLGSSVTTFVGVVVVFEPSSLVIVVVAADSWVTQVVAVVGCYSSGDKQRKQSQKLNSLSYELSNSCVVHKIFRASRQTVQGVTIERSLRMR